MSPSVPAPSDWDALRQVATLGCVARFQDTLTKPPPAEHAEQAILEGVAEFVQAKEALKCCLNDYLVDFNIGTAWPVITAQSEKVLSALAYSLGVVAVHRDAQPGLSQTLLSQVDALCPIWGRLLRNLSGGLLYVVQSKESPTVLGQFAVQAVGLSGFRPTVTGDQLVIHASPEPAEKLARFFGV